MAGSIQDLGNGRYRLRYGDHSKYIRAKSERDANKQLAQFVAEVEAGDYNKLQNVTFAALVEKWIELYAVPELAPKTRKEYIDMLDARILPRFGRMKLESIKPLALLSFYRELRGTHKVMRKPRGGERREGTSDGLGDLAIKGHHRVISCIFSRAVKWQIIKENPARLVDAPKVEKKEAAHYDLNEVALLLEKLEQEELYHQVAVMLGLMAGLRLGEVVGLQWNDIDFDGKAIRIERSVQRLTGHGVFEKATKNESSVRRITISDTLLKLLKTYRADQQNRGFLSSGNNPIFVNIHGNQYDPNLISGWFRRFIAKSNLPKLTFHGLRHSSATILISQGMDIRTVAGRLGHSSSVITQNVYSHFLQSRDQAAAEIMEQAITKTERKEPKSNGRILRLRRKKA